MRVILNGALLVAGVLLLAYSVEPLYHAARNTEQVTVTCDSFAQSPPSALWVRITGCEVDYLGAGFREQNGRIVELYFPARPVGWPKGAPAPLVATTRDADVLALAEGTMGGGRTPDQEQFLVMMLQIVTALRAAREIDGYGEDNVVDRLKTRADLSSLSTPLSPDARVVDLHARPSLLGPGATAAAGLLVLGMLAVLRSKRRGIASAAPATPRASAREGTLRLMLLNLPAEAGRDAIEHAPPLGRREEVIAALRRAIGELRFDAAGIANVDQADVELTLDIGPSDPVHTAVVRARGNAAAPLRSLLERTGWRAFDAKAGEFFEARDATTLDHTAA
jgi:hypothetical protein